MKRFLFVLLVVALWPLLLLAAEPWKGKKYTEWSEKEIEKVLQDSPWAKRAAVSIPVGGAGGGGRRGRRGGFDAGADTGAGAGAAGTGIEDRGGRPSLEDTSAPARREIPFLIRWHTALPIRQAVVRGRISSAGLTPEQAEEWLKQTPTEYVVVVSGFPIPLMEGATAEKLKAVTFLKRGQGKPIPLQEIKMTRGAAPEFYFIFPRGETPLTEADKSVEFISTFGRYDVRKKFSLKDMLYEGKLEL